jgi:alpha-galactosidase
MCPNAQTLRSVALSTRFNVACFGVLGYELDFGELTPEERRQIARQIQFYKKHRNMLQFGRFSRYFPRRGQRESWQMRGKKTVIAGIYNLSYQAAPGADVLKVLEAKKGKRYRIRSVRQHLRIGRFGGLIKHVAPVSLNPNGAVLRTADRHYTMEDGGQKLTASGCALTSCWPLPQRFTGAGYDKSMRVQGDFGSCVFKIEEEKSK